MSPPCAAGDGQPAAGRAIVTDAPYLQSVTVLPLTGRHFADAGTPLCADCIHLAVDVMLLRAKDRGPVGPTP